MCLALPARIVERLPDERAIVELGGVRTPASLAFVPQAQVGDYVIVHVGHAIGLLDPEEAEKTLALFAQAQQAIGLGCEAAPADAATSASTAAKRLIDHGESAEQRA